MNNPPACPSYEEQKSYGQMMAVGGMTLRDYFAAKALQALLSDPAWRQANKFCSDPKKPKGLLRDEAAIAAYKQADAMLKAREA
jgi:hypothetical protein